MVAAHLVSGVLRAHGVLASMFPPPFQYLLPSPDAYCEVLCIFFFAAVAPANSLLPTAIHRGAAGGSNAPQSSRVVVPCPPGRSGLVVARASASAALE